MSRSRAQKKQADKKAKRRRAVAAKRTASGIPPVRPAEPMADAAGLDEQMRRYQLDPARLPANKREVVDRARALDAQLLERGWQGRGPAMLYDTMLWAYSRGDGRVPAALVFALDHIVDRVEVQWHDDDGPDAPATYHPIDVVLDHLSDIEDHRRGDSLPAWAQETDRG